MTYSDTGKLSPETQSAIEQEIRILLRVIIFVFLMFVYLFSQNMPEYLGACKIAKVPWFFRNVNIAHKVNRGTTATGSMVGTLSTRWQAYLGITCCIRFKCNPMDCQLPVACQSPLSMGFSRHE